MQLNHRRCIFYSFQNLSLTLPTIQQFGLTLRCVMLLAANVASRGLVNSLLSISTPQISFH